MWNGDQNGAVEDLASLIVGRAGDAMALNQRHLNPKLGRVVRTLGFDREWVEGRGEYLIDSSGQAYLDLLSGYGVFALGRNHPYIKDQLQRVLAADTPSMPQLGVATLPGVLGEELIARSPAPLDAVLLTNSGTEAVEAAIKLARHHTGRPNLIAFRGGFHGRSLGALSLTASKTKYRKHFGPLLPGVFHASYGDLASVERELFARVVAPEDVAAIVVEPVLGEGGYVVPPPEFLRGLRGLCDRHGMLLVFDEVQSGMGRTGRMFAAEHFGVVPDVLVLAKGLASGMPLGAMVARRPLMTWPSGSHGSTCGGNPVCIAAALATIALVEGELLANTEAVGAHLMARLRQELAGVPAVTEVRGLGLMIGVDFATHELASDVAQACYRAGLLVLECGDRAIRLSPPLVVSRAQADEAVAIFARVCRAARASA